MVLWEAKAWIHIALAVSVHTILKVLWKGRVIDMASYVSPGLREKFETLSIDLKNNILERNVQLYTIYDLIDILEVISKGAWCVPAQCLPFDRFSWNHKNRCLNGLFRGYLSLEPPGLRILIHGRSGWC